MSVLSTEERKLLERVVVDAREVAESACRERVRALEVAQERKSALLSDEENRLRVALRARARQLGSIDVLVAEAGFEHWHRMLFTRFLVDNGLLVDDVAGMPVSWSDVREAAAEYGISDPWELAASWAAQMLPGIFRADDPLLQIRLPVEARQELERLLSLLPVEVVVADDALGWVYQYWQSRRKDEVNRSERKIGGADLAPVTQLFTEDYMVRFLLENSLGAWWGTRHPDSPLLVGWEYLRRNDDGTPAVGGFDHWPLTAAEVTVMDPCCGSGHFLTAAFGMLWRMRAEEEGLSPAAAQDKVIRDNLYGLELDPRCTQIATFALALESWKSSGYRRLPLPNIACTGIPARAPLDDWLELGRDDPRLRAALTRLHALFTNADTLGSLIDPVRATEQAGLESVDWAQVAPLVQKALTAEAGRQGDDPTSAVFGEAAAGIARAADYLSRQYYLISTNVPYLGRGKQGSTLASFADANYPDASGDLATIALSRCVDFAANTGLVAAVSPQSWLVQSGFRHYRSRVLGEGSLLLLARLGSRAFSAIAGEVVQPVLSVYRKTDRPADFLTIDVSQAPTIDAKCRWLRCEPLVNLLRVAVVEDPQNRVTFERDARGTRLGERFAAAVGIQTGDNERFTRNFWELAAVQSPWVLMSRAPTAFSVVDGASKALLWENGAGQLHAYVGERLGGSVGAWIRGEQNWNRPGILMSRMGGLPASVYPGGAYADNCMVITSDGDSESDLGALWELVRTGEVAQRIRAVDQSLNITPGSALAAKVQLASDHAPLPKPSSDEPTQWLFRGLGNH